MILFSDIAILKCFLLDYVVLLCRRTFRMGARNLATVLIGIFVARSNSVSNFMSVGNT